MSKNLYGSDDSLITGGIIYDETEEKTQDLINAEQKKAGVYYCTCSTAANTQKKTVTISGITSLYDGLKICVRFINQQGFNGTPTLDLNSLGAYPIQRDSTSMAIQYEWVGGEVLDLVYDSTLQRWIIVGGERANEGHYGKTKLFTSVVSPSTNMAATPASVKQVNDKVGDGVLDSGFTATDLTEAANELKNTLNQLDQNMAYVESGNTASRNYSKGDFISWKGTLYTANGTISSGQSFSTGTGGNLDLVAGNNASGGGLNSLKNSVTKTTNNTVMWFSSWFTQGYGMTSCYIPKLPNVSVSVSSVEFKKPQQAISQFQACTYSGGDSGEYFRVVQPNYSSIFPGEVNYDRYDIRVTFSYTVT